MNLGRRASSPTLLSPVICSSGEKEENAKRVQKNIGRVSRKERDRIHAHDLAILNRVAGSLNMEAEETLEYQADPWRPEME